MKDTLWGEFSEVPTKYKNIGYVVTSNNSSVFLAGCIKNKDKYSDIYLLKTDTAFNVIWEKQLKGASNENIAYDITYDDENNIYITGFFKDSVFIGNQTIIPREGANIFIAKFSSEGEFIWANSASSGIAWNEYNAGWSICFDNMNSIYVSGYVEKNALFPLLSKPNMQDLL